MSHHSSPPPSSVISHLFDLVSRHTAERSRCLNMIASENRMSPLTEAMLGSDLGNRYAYGPMGDKLFAGARTMDDIEAVAAALARDLFHASYVNLQAVSGMVANMVAYETILRHGDIVLSCAPRHGGHYSHDRNGLLDRWGARVEHLPFDEQAYQIDIPAAVAMIHRLKPRLVIVGGSEILFPVPLKELRAACDATETTLMYDAAHVAGLIAGGAFQQPLEEGADIMTMSTNKSMGGPDHGIIAVRDEKRFRRPIERAIGSVFVSNTHMHHIAAAAVTLAELHVFGRDYAASVIRNSAALGAALTKQGVRVLADRFGFSRSHMIIIDTGMDAVTAMRKLENASIIVSPCPLPQDTEGFCTGLRIGTSELTKCGMRETEMVVVAELIADILLNKKSAAYVAHVVGELCQSYRSLSYCFSPEIDYNKITIHP